MIVPKKMVGDKTMQGNSLLKDGTDVNKSVNVHAIDVRH